MAFNPNEHLMKIGKGDAGKDYLPVQWRLVWFRDAYPDGSIETEMIHLDLDKPTQEEVSVWNNEKRRSEKVIKEAPGIAVFRATVKDGRGGVATGYKSEKAASFPDFIEKAETGAIGRALAALGYGTQFAPEMDEAHRIVDSPVERTPSAIDRIRSEWATAYTIPDAQIEERWPKYVAHILGKAVADPDLQPPQIARITGDLETRRRTQEKKSA